MSDIRHRKLVAAATLTHLLTLPAPECCNWQIEHDATIVGQLDCIAALDSIRVALTQWAALLDDPVWEYLPGDAVPCYSELSVTGTYQGQQVTIWDCIDAAPDVDVADLSTPPQADAAPAVRS